MSFRPRSMLAAVLGLGIASMQEAIQPYYRLRSVGLSRGAPLLVSRKHEASRPAKHPSRTKSRKRRRSIVRMRGGRS